MGLLVNTYVSKSHIHGVGLFAADDIPKGTKIWAINPRLDLFMHDNIVNQYFTDLEKEHLETYCVKEGSGWRVIWDNTRFINHSNNPNITRCDDIDYATKDIKKGEELTCDYRTLDTSLVSNEWV